MNLNLHNAYPDINPIAFSLGPLDVRWYSLAYMAGILLGWIYIKRLQRSTVVPIVTYKQLDDLILWVVLGIVLGGRLGYVFFYNPDYYLAHPEEIFKIWEGGMSFHGGMIGLVCTVLIFSAMRKCQFIRVMDLIAAAAPIGLFFGRVANFINGELYGKTTNVSWGMIFPGAGYVPRHPSQLYEAGLEGVLLFLILALFIFAGNALLRPGLISGLFLLGYGLARFFVEFVREPDAQLGYLSLGLTMGQWLCVPMIILGIGLILWQARRPKLSYDVAKPKRM